MSKIISKRQADVLIASKTLELHAPEKAWSAAELAALGRELAEKVPDRTEPSADLLLAWLQRHGHASRSAKSVRYTPTQNALLSSAAESQTYGPDDDGEKLFALLIAYNDACCKQITLPELRVKLRGFTAAAETKRADAVSKAAQPSDTTVDEGLAALKSRVEGAARSLDGADNQRFLTTHRQPPKRCSRRWPTSRPTSSAARKTSCPRRVKSWRESWRRTCGSCTKKCGCSTPPP